ncbi:histone-fold-containing protein [Lentinula aff. lateritia]|uniref:Histone-fold-containing protein n=1 Tax=Lentinula aff. lateritia TaxID=2804960 RepID=A0ACC1UDI5_9AGAR|nr:histone-fold-containing protein [Lentinula aff. lateritia]
MPRKENPGPLSAQQQQDLVSEGIDNFELPKSLVTKIAKSAVPDNTKLQKEAILSLVKGSTVFINYLGVAHEVAQSKQHKSISASDVLKALEMIELGDLVEPLSAELQVYRDQVKPDKSGRASTASASVNGVTPASASTNAKTKGKEKASTSASAVGAGAAPIVPTIGGTETLPPPFTSAPLVHRGEQLGNVSAPGDHDSISVAFNPNAKAAEEEDHRMDVDDEHQDVGAIEQGDAEMGDVADEHGDQADGSDLGDEVQEEEEEEETLQDMVAVEEEELREDAKGVEQRGAASEHKK